MSLGQYFVTHCVAYRLLEIEPHYGGIFIAPADAYILHLQQNGP